MVFEFICNSLLYCCKSRDCNLGRYVTKDAAIISVLRGLKKYCRSRFVQARFLFKSKKRSLIWLHSVICISIHDEGMTISFSFKCDKQTNDSDVQGAQKIFRTSKYHYLDQHARKYMQGW